MRLYAPPPLLPYKKNIFSVIWKILGFFLRGVLVKKIKGGGPSPLFILPQYFYLGKIKHFFLSDSFFTPKNHFETFWRPFWILFCWFLVYSWSCGNKVVLVFLSNPFVTPKNHFETFWQPFWNFMRPFSILNLRIPGLLIKLWKQSGFCFSIEILFNP